jgi:hypothetical protein
MILWLFAYWMAIGVGLVELFRRTGHLDEGRPSYVVEAMAVVLVGPPYLGIVAGTLAVALAIVLAVLLVCAVLALALAPVAVVVVVARGIYDGAKRVLR